MIGAKELPARKDLVEFTYAVAGHAGTLCDPDGELFIKPCTQQEIDFYESANAGHTDFAMLMPVFMGTLLLNDATDINSIDEQLPVVAEHISQHMKEEVVALAHTLHPKAEPAVPVDPNSPWAPGRNKKIATDTAIVLENSAYGFERPNIMDCKLGVRLWANDAPDEKKKRFDRISNETTHRDLGFRVAGMRVFRGSDNEAELDSEEYLKYDKDWGRLSVSTANVVESFRKYIFNASADVDEETGKTVARAFHNDLLRVEEVLSREESRMYSASLLFVFEGDGEALRQAVNAASTAALLQAKRQAEVAAKKRAAQAAHSSGRSNARIDSGIEMGDDGELILHQDQVAEVDEDLDVENDEDDEDGALSLPRIYSLRLIDFAHADWVPGEGPDENVLKGVRSLIRIFDELSK